MKFVKWVGTILIVLGYFVLVNEASILMYNAYPQSPIDPIFLCNGLFSLVAVLGIQQVWVAGTKKEKEQVTDEELETRYLFNKKEVHTGLFEAAKDLLNESEHYNDIISNARDKDKQLKIILKKYYGRFRGKQYLAKAL